MYREEETLIAENAESCNERFGPFMRKVSLGYRPRPVADLEICESLFRLHGDLGRTDGLLKLRVARGERVSIAELRQIERTAVALRHTQKELSKNLLALRGVR